MRKLLKIAFMKLVGLVQLAMGQVIGYFKKFCDIIMTSL